MEERAYIEQILNSFSKSGIKYLLIGRQALVLYGFPVISFDFDLWILPEDREKVFKILLKESFEPSSSLEDKKPVVFFIKDYYKIDVFFVRGWGKLSFEKCYQRATVISTEKFSIRIPSPEDLIYLKSFHKPLKEKDKIDIELLKTLVKKTKE